VSSFNGDLEAFNGSQVVNALDVLSKRVPTAFVTTLLPWLERALSLHSPPSADWPTFGIDDLSSGWHERVYVVQFVLLRAFAGALTIIGEENPVTFAEIAARMAQMPYLTPQLLLAETYKRLPDRYADSALGFLLNDRRRMQLGEHDSYDTRQLIAAIYPWLSPEDRHTLEDAIIAENRVWPKYGMSGLRWRGLHCLYLLQALPLEEISPRAAQILHELERKFPGVTASAEPTTSIGGMVGSPIPGSAAERMSDQAWLRAMAKYHGSVEHAVDPLRGGAQQLSQILLELVKKHPERFFGLAMQTPTACDAAYVDAFARGLAESDATAAQVFAVVHRFMAHPDRVAKRQLVWALQKRIADDLPGDLMALMEDYLFDVANDPDDNVTDPYSGYINSIRGSAFEALMRALDRQGTEAAKQRMWELIEYVGADGLTMLRAGAIEQLLYRLHEDRDRAVQLFERIVSGHPTLLQSHYTQEFIYYASYRHVAQMLPFTRQLLDIDHEQSQQRGAELICLVSTSRAITCDAATRAAIDELAASLATGRVMWRRGSARIYAHNLILDKLAAFFNDEDESVRLAAGGFLHELRYERPDSVIETIDAYTRSKSLYDATHLLTDYLWEYGTGKPRHRIGYTFRS